MMRGPVMPEQMASLGFRHLEMLHLRQDYLPSDAQEINNQWPLSGVSKEPASVMDMGLL